MAAYELLSSLSTVQVLSPTVVNEVVYVTIATLPNHFIVSTPLETFLIGTGEDVLILEFFSGNVEGLVNEGKAVSAVGVQSLDASGLLADQVSFTVRYVPPGTGNTAITGEALVPTTLLATAGATAGDTSYVQAQAIIEGVYQNLVKLAGG